MKWTRARLEEIADSVDYGYTASASKSGGGPKFLRITDIQDGRVDWSSVPRCECSAKKGASFRLKDGDIVFARTGATTGKSYLLRHIPEPAVFASYLIRVQPRQSVVYSGYLARYFETQDYWDQIFRSSTGTAQGGVNASKLKALTVPLPPLSEQRRIAAILDKADALRAKRREAIAKLDQLLQSVFLDMFGDPVTNPKGWSNERCLGDVADVCSGVTKGRRTAERVREVPYLAVANVQDRHLRLGAVKTIEATEAEIDRYRLVVDDLLLTEGGDPDKLGRGALWDGSIAECIHQNHVFRVRVTASEINPVYLNWLVGSARGKRYFLGVAKQTTGIASINKTQLKRFPLLIPPIKLQRQFADTVSKIDKHRQQLMQGGQSSERLMQSLQREAFAGTL